MNTPYCSTCAEKDALIKRLSWNPSLHMLRPGGLDETIRTLSTETTYTVVLADVDKMKAINTATGSHVKTDRYLAAGFAVRDGEIAGQLHDKGDEILFILDEHSRHADAQPDAFVARIARQLAGQPLTISERYALAAAQRCPVSQARLSATFSTMSGVRVGDVLDAIEWLSEDVLRLKTERDARVMA